MNQPLQDLTNTTFNNQPSGLKAKGKQLIQLPSIQEHLSTSVGSIDFGDCVCGTILERKIGIMLLANQESAKIINMRVIFEDESLRELPEYIYGIRKQASFQYFDQYKFKAAQRGVYNFIIGVKTPDLPNYPVKAIVELTLEGSKNSIKISLSQVPKYPEVRCNRELVSEEGVRVIKMGVIKNKSKKEIKIAFKSTENLNFTLLTQLLGLANQTSNDVEVKPKSVLVGGKGIFLLTFITNSPVIEGQPVCVRRILVMRVKDTKIHFHFPIEVTFYAGNGKVEPSVE